MASLLTLASMAGCIVTPFLCSRFPSTRGYLVCMGVVGTLVMLATWMMPGNGVSLLAVLLLNGFTTSLLGPVIQALPVVLPEIGPRYAGSAGGIIAEVSLLLSFCLPIVVSAIAGADYGLNFAIFSCVYALALAPVVLLPKLPNKSG